jgi:O-antigen/teichoic acid export membrane protein
MPTFFLGMYFPTKIVGYYSLGNRIVNLPATLLGDSIRQVLYPTAGKEYNRTGDIAEIVHGIVRRLVQIGIFPIMMIGFCGAPLFSFLFGAEWTEAGVYAQILCIFTLPQFITSPLTAIFSVKSYQEKGLIYNISLAASRFMALFLAGRLGDPRTTLAAYAITSSIIYFLTFVWLLRLGNVSAKWGLGILLKYISGSAMLLLPTLFLAHVGYGISLILISLFLETMIYVLILYKVDKTIQTSVSEALHKFRNILDRT